MSKVTPVVKICFMLRPLYALCDKGTARICLKICHFMVEVTDASAGSACWGSAPTGNETHGKGNHAQVGSVKRCAAPAPCCSYPELRRSHLWCARRSPSGILHGLAPPLGRRGRARCGLAPAAPTRRARPVQAHPRCDIPSALRS